MADNTRLKKLVQLANFLDDLPHDKFHMPEWCSEDAAEHNCGTAGCAAGWAITLFYKEGFVFKSSSSYGRFYRIPCYKDSTSYFAFAEFFDIHPNEAYDITMNLHSYCLEFDLDSPDDITPRHAAKIIRRVIANYDSDLLKVENENMLGIPHLLMTEEG